MAFSSFYNFITVKKLFVLFDRSPQTSNRWVWLFKIVDFWTEFAIYHFSFLYSLVCDWVKTKFHRAQFDTSALDSCVAPTVELCTFVRIKRPIKSQQTYNQSSCLIILGLFVLLLCTSMRIFVFVSKPRSKKKTEEQTKYQAILFKMAIVALLLNIRRVQLNGMLLKSYRNQHVNTAKWIRTRLKDSQLSPLAMESRQASAMKVLRKTTREILVVEENTIVCDCLLSTEAIGHMKTCWYHKLNDTKMKSIIHIE